MRGKNNGRVSAGPSVLRQGDCAVRMGKPLAFVQGRSFFYPWRLLQKACAEQGLRVT